MIVLATSSNAFRTHVSFVKRHRGVIENIVSPDGQIAINRQIDVRELRVNAHAIVCGRSAIAHRVRASVWAFTHALANVDLAVETLFSRNPVRHPLTPRTLSISP